MEDENISPSRREILLNKYSPIFALDPCLIEAIIEVESSWDPWAIRVEPNFKNRNCPAKFSAMNRISLNSEISSQATSWGLMQLLGATARDLGYSGSLPALCEPDKGVYWGCTFLKKLKHKYPLMEDTIAAYNAGHAEKKNGIYINQDYVDKVLKAFNVIKNKGK